MRVLVIDDELAVRQVLVDTLERGGYSVDQAASAAEAAAKLVRGDVDVAVCDIKMPDGNGIDLLRDTRAAGIDTTFLMLTAFASVETAVEALRAGATDFMTKPARSEEVLHRLGQIAVLRGLREENRVLRKVVGQHAPKLFQFSSTTMLEVERLAKRVAPTDSTVLITGESGTGKGVTARRIHEQSNRASGIFLAVNCSAIPEHLLEAEFFGHTKGAFTGADRARKGLFLEADKGTLFLDEIGELPLHMQTKLLHVIEEKDVRAVGSDSARRVDTRIIAATNRDIAALVKQGKFREDLYFRLSMFEIRLPPLRERRSDLPGLIHFILDELRRGSVHRDPIELEPAAAEALCAYGWPGNVRELENVLNRAHILADDGRITLVDLPVEISRSVPAPAAGNGIAIAREGYLRDQMRAIEASLVMRALEDANEDRKLAATRLGIGLSSLYRKLEEFERLGIAKVSRPEADGVH